MRGSMSSAASLNRAMPTWGSRGWRICTSICMVFILVLGTWMTVSELMAGYHYWWFNLTFVLFAFAGFGLILAVAEGYRAAKNILNYGLHPGGKELPELIEYDPYADEDNEASLSSADDKPISEIVDEDSGGSEE